MRPHWITDKLAVIKSDVDSAHGANAPLKANYDSACRDHGALSRGLSEARERDSRGDYSSLEAQVKAALEKRDRCEAAMNKQRQLWHEQGELYRRLVLFLSEQHQDQKPILVMHKAPAPKPLPVEKLNADIDAARAGIRCGAADIARLRNAPLPETELAERIAAYVQAKVQAAAPDVDWLLQPSGLRGDGYGGDPINWPTLRHSPHGEEIDVVGLAAWLFPEQMQQRLLDEARAVLDEDPPGPPLVERPALIRKAEDELLALERREEALILQLAAAGITVLRRVDANPLAVLEIERVEAGPPDKGLAVVRSDGSAVMRSGGTMALRRQSGTGVLPVYRGDERPPQHPNDHPDVLGATDIEGKRRPR